jgi:hypothetical protein
MGKQRTAREIVRDFIASDVGYETEGMLGQAAELLAALEAEGVYVGRLERVSIPEVEIERNEELEEPNPELVGRVLLPWRVRWDVRVRVDGEPALELSAYEGVAYAEGLNRLRRLPGRDVPLFRRVD